LAIWREPEEKDGIARALVQLGNVAFNEGNYELADKHWQEGLAVSRGLGRASRITANVCLHMGETARARGDYAAARSFYEESLAIYQEVGSKPGVAMCSHNLGYVAIHEGNYDQATAYFTDSIGFHQERNDRGRMAYCLLGISQVCRAQGYTELAVQLAGAATAAMAATGHRLYYHLEQIEHEESLAAMRAALGPEAFDKAWAEGQAISLEEALGLFDNRPQSF
jgi:tetratricopeptide (TPR) repeat protein